MLVFLMLTKSFTMITHNNNQGVLQNILPFQRANNFTHDFVSKRDFSIILPFKVIIELFGVLRGRFIGGMGIIKVDPRKKPFVMVFLKPVQEFFINENRGDFRSALYSGVWRMVSS